MITMMDSPDRVYLYRGKWSTGLLGVTFFGGGGWYLLHAAASRDGAFLHGGSDPFWRHMTSGLYTTVAWMSFAMVAVALLSPILRYANPQRVVLSADGISAPRNGFARRRTFIPYAQIVAVTPYQTFGQRLLKISHAGGTLQLAGGLFQSGRDFDDFVGEFERRRR
jgi:hypothetical protein